MEKDIVESDEAEDMYVGVDGNNSTEVSLVNFKSSKVGTTTGT